MAFSISITARKLLNRANLLTTAGLNALGFNTITLTGQADTADIADDAITPAKLEYGAYHWASTGGTANAITLTTGNSLSGTPETGEVVAFKATANNTGNVDVTVDSYSSANLYKHGGTELEPDDIRSGQIYEIRFDGSSWQVVGTRGKREVIIGVDAGSSDNYEFTPDPGVTAHASKDIVFLQCNTANTGACSLGGVAIKKQKDQDLASGDIKAGQWVVLVHDGTYWQMVSPVSNNQAPGVPGNNAGLVVTPNSSNPTFQMDVYADWISLTDDDGNAVVTTAIGQANKLTIDISQGGTENGRDTGLAETGSTDYWLFVCYNQNTDTVFGLVSPTEAKPASSSAFFTHYAKVGWVYNDSAGDFAQHASYRQGRWYFVSGQLDAAADTTAQAHTINHPFGRVPAGVRAVLVCNTDEDGYVAGEELQGDNTWTFDGSTAYYPTYTAFGSGTAVKMIQRVESTGVYYRHATTGAVTTAAAAGTPSLLTNFKWKLYAEF